MNQDNKTTAQQVRRDKETLLTIVNNPHTSSVGFKEAIDEYLSLMEQERVINRYHS